MSDNDLPTWCPQCGPRVRVDEDGCCLECGATACGAGADAAIIDRHRIAALEAKRQCGVEGDGGMRACDNCGAFAFFGQAAPDDCPFCAASEYVPRKPGCLCQWEEGDSPCPVHRFSAP